MYLLIFQSLGTQELILIGIVALIFLGPRKLPDYARKIGKIMSEFRNTTNEFRDTWEREVNFEEEAKALKLDLLEDEDDGSVKVQPRSNKELASSENNILPEIREIDASEFELVRNQNSQNEDDTSNRSSESVQTEEVTEETDKRSWL